MSPTKPRLLSIPTPKTHSKTTNDPALAPPADVTVEGEFKRITVTWTPPQAPEEEEEEAVVGELPDYVIVNVKKVRRRRVCVCVID